MGEVKLMIEVAPTWWLRSIATNIFGCTQLFIISNWTEVYLYYQPLLKCRKVSVALTNKLTQLSVWSWDKILRIA